MRFLVDRRGKLLRALFIFCWIVGILGFWGTPIARLLLLDVRTGDSVDDALLALHPSNQWYHPRFYVPLRDAFRALVEPLPADVTTVGVIAGQDVDEPDARRDQRELLQRNMKIWAYPRRVVWCAVASVEAILTECRLTGDETIITWDLGDVPGYTCTTGAQGLSLCR